jgi:hypothetical protein
VDHRLIVAGRLRTDDPLQVDHLRNADSRLNADVLKVDHLLDHRRELRERSVAEDSDRNKWRHKPNVLRGLRSNVRKLSVPRDRRHRLNA